MELKYGIIVYLGIVVVLIIAVLYFTVGRKPRKYDRGVKLAGTYLLDNDSFYVRQKKIYKLLCLGLAASVVFTLISACILAARPYYRQKITEEKYCRDIILCLDVSTSVDELNARIIGKLKDTVMNLSGERFGIVIFNTSPVVLSPLTSDHEYTLNALDMIQKALENRIKSYDWFSYYSYSDEDYYLERYISDGTLVGNELRGSSLIGDGLAATVRNFPDNEGDEERTKIVILTTDNDPYGQELVDIQEAARICKEHGIIVYGIGTKEMTNYNLIRMKDAVESTGGAFFLEETSGTYDKIVELIEGHSENLVKGDTYYIDHDLPKKAFIRVLIGFAAMTLFARLLRK